MADFVFTQLLPIANHATGQVSTAARPLPANIVGAAIRIDCTTGNPATPFAGIPNPFNQPGMRIVIITAFSWDGGTTFPEQASTPALPSATGVWGDGPFASMAPVLYRGIPFNGSLGTRPTHYRAGWVVTGGPISFGVSIAEDFG